MVASWDDRVRPPGAAVRVTVRPATPPRRGGGRWRGSDRAAGASRATPGWSVVPGEPGTATSEATGPPGGPASRARWARRVGGRPARTAAGRERPPSVDV